MDKETAIYCRVSTQQQTTDRQEQELLEYAKNCGYTIKQENIFIDIISGFKEIEERKEYAKLLKKIDEQKIERILISEFSRLGRNATDLLNEINKLRNKDVDLYFRKQNFSVTKSDGLQTDILLHVLALVSSYEIELMSERTIHGKTVKIRQGVGLSDSRAYGYHNVNKHIEIYEKEAEIIKDIFNMYAYENKSSIEICKELNKNNIPTPFTNLKELFDKNRDEKGMELKEYKNFDIDNLKWRPSTINRILDNKLYTGLREITTYKPDPTNKLQPKKRKNREIFDEYSEQCENLRIIDDDTFARVKEKKLGAKYNKNNATKHISLLKHFLICGECGSKFGVGKQEGENLTGKTYKCYGSVSSYSHKPICKKGGALRQNKLDGLVIHLSSKMLCDINLKEQNNALIIKFNKEKERLNLTLKNLNEKEDAIEKQYKTRVRNFMKLKNKNDILIEEMDKTSEAYKRDIEDIKVDIIETQNELRIINNKIISVTTMNENLNLWEEKINNKREKRGKIKTWDEFKKAYKEARKICPMNIDNKGIIYKINEDCSIAIMHDDNYLYDKNFKKSEKVLIEEIKIKKEIIRDEIETILDKIIIYRVETKWWLIIIKYKNNIEFWGTIKNRRYKNDEKFYDEIMCLNGEEYRSWFIDNTLQCFEYKKDTNTIIYNGESPYYNEILNITTKNKKEKTFKTNYTFDELNKILIEKEIYTFFPVYNFEDVPIKKSSINSTETH